MVLSGNVVEHRIGSLLNGYSKRSRARRFWVGGQPPGPPAPGTRPEPGDVPPASQSVYRLPPFRFGPTTSVGGGAISVSQLASNRNPFHDVARDLPLPPALEFCVFTVLTPFESSGWPRNSDVSRYGLACASSQSVISLPDGRHFRIVSSVKRFSPRTARQSNRSQIAKRSAQFFVLRHSEPPNQHFKPCRRRPPASSISQGPLAPVV